MRDECEKGDESEERERGEMDGGDEAVNEGAEDDKEGVGNEGSENDWPSKRGDCCTGAKSLRKV